MTIILVLHDLLKVHGPIFQPFKSLAGSFARRQSWVNGNPKPYLRRPQYNNIARTIQRAFYMGELTFFYTPEQDPCYPF